LSSSWKRTMPASGAAVRVSAPVRSLLAPPHCGPLPSGARGLCPRDPPSIRAGSRPDTTFSIRREASLGSAGRGTPSHARTAKPPRDCSGPSQPARAVPLYILSLRPGIYAARGCACFFSTAPAGGVPVFRYFHNSIRSFRASATIPIFRIRVLPLPYRSPYHRLSSLSG
jgi:hypothetical protein